MKRRLLSQKDGTTFKEDVEDIIFDIDHWVKKHLHISSPIIDAMQWVVDKIKEGTPTDQIIDNLITSLPDGVEPKVKAIYEWIQANLPKAIEIYTEYDGEESPVSLLFDEIREFNSEAVNECVKAKIGSILLGLHDGDLKRRLTDSIIQETFRNYF